VYQTRSLTQFLLLFAVNIILFITAETVVCLTVDEFAFFALTLFIGRQEECPACKKFE